MKLNYLYSVLLIEAKLIDRFGTQISRLSQELDISPEEIVKSVEPIEKGTKVYVPWLLNQMSPSKMGNRIIRLPEDSQRVIEVLNKFNLFKHKLKHKDIARYKFRELEGEIDKLGGTQVKSKRQETRDIKAIGVEDYRESSNYKIVEVTTVEAACQLAKNTKWCTSDPETAEEYLPLFVVFERQNGKLVKIAQYTEDFGQIMDVKDNPLESIPDELKKLMRPTKSHDMWMDATTAYRYAHNVIKGKWPEGEETIRQLPVLAFRYARDIIKGRWPEGEEAIKRDSYHWQQYTDFIERERERERV